MLTNYKAESVNNELNRGGGGLFLSILELTHWPFSRGLLENTHTLIVE